MGTDSLYVSNLNYNSDESSLRAAFPDSIRAQIVFDRNTNQSKGFGFVKFDDAATAQANLDQVGGPGGTISIDGRDVKVNYAHTKEQKDRGGFQPRGNRGGGFQRGRSGGNYRGGRSGNWGDQSSFGGRGYGGQGGYNQYGHSDGSSFGHQGQNWYGSDQSQSYGAGGDYSQQGGYGQQQSGWGGAF